MDKQHIIHKAKTNYSFALDKDTIRLTLRTKRDNLKNVWVIYDHEDGWPIDEYGKHYWKKTKDLLKISQQTKDYDYWQVDVVPFNRKMRYGFLLEDLDGTIHLYIETGFYNPTENNIMNDINSFFAFPYIHESDVFKAPDWVKDTVWYQVFPDRFITNQTKEMAYRELGEEEIFGGTLNDLIENLDYIKELGANGIYLTPIFDANTSHRYDTNDYYTIDPVLGNKNDFKNLVDLCHEKDMRIMLDGVFNHVGSQSYLFQDVIKNGEQSKFAEWFHIKQFPITTTEGKLIGDNYHNFVPRMPKLNTENPEVQRYILNIATYWIEHFDIDGWRLDVANEVDHHFWRLFRSEVKKIKPDLYILGEIWHDSTAWLQGDQFDGVMNYLQNKPILELLIYQTITAEEFREKMIQGFIRYGINVDKGMFNLLDSHDTARVSYQIEEKSRVDLAISMMALLPGSISIYYGTEKYMQSGEDPDNRRLMDWESETSKEITAIMKLKRSGRLLNNQQTSIELVNDHLIQFIKEDEQFKLIAYYNIGKNTENITDILSTEKSKEESEVLFETNITKEVDETILESLGSIIILYKR